MNLSTLHIEKILALKQKLTMPETESQSHLSITSQ